MAMANDAYYTSGQSHLKLLSRTVCLCSPVECEYLLTTQKDHKNSFQRNHNLLLLHCLAETKTTVKMFKASDKDS